MMRMHWIAALLSLSFPVLCGWAQSPDERTWGEFLAWLPAAPPIDNPATLLQAYRKTLSERGVAPGEIDGQVQTIVRLLRVRQDGWRVIFNNIYSDRSGGGFSVQPNAWLVSAIEGRRPGRALDAGMGQGRNSVFLALKGWTVTGFDVSDAGLAIAQRDAARAGVQLATFHKSEAEFDYGTAQWDLMVFTYVPFRLEDPQYVERLRAALRPGGIVVVESFASEAGRQNRRAVDLDPDALRRAFREFRILRLEDKEATPDWTREPTRLVKLIAERPE